MPSTSVLLPRVVYLAGGRFLMGDNAGRPDERPAHEVTIAPFRAAVTPVTNGEYASFLAATGHPAPKFWADSTFNDPRRPVVGVTWADAVAYCDWLSVEGQGRFRLPTEAEREFAARGELAGADWPWGSEPPNQRPDLREIAALARPHVPTELCANGFGLMCLADNVHEWCADWYDAAYYAVSPSEAPAGPASGRRRASRGGAWRHQVKFNRCAARSSLDPTFEYNDYGFRVYGNA